jgi:hypothetical protein
MHAVTVITARRVIRPTTEDGDAFYGLAPMTNGTAAESRRACVAPPGFRWERSTGAPATGVLYVPSPAPTTDS